jgi:fatty acid amide hydrolase
MIQGLFYWALYNTVLNRSFWFLIILYYLSRLVIAIGMRFYRKSKFPALIKQRRAECDKSFDYDVKPDELPQTTRDKLLQIDLLGLRKLIWSQEVSSEQVLRFYFYRSKTIGRELNAAIEANFEQALKLAKEADQQIKTTPEDKRPPLLGLPISIKENYMMKGFETTQGFETRLGVKEAKTAPLIDHLVKQGAIPFVRSNVPQALMAPESLNAIYGICQNPHDKTRTSGGSSGGEGALVAAGCSPAGLGNDIGGSIRIPATFNGVFGFKPTSGRFNINDQLPDMHPYFEKGTCQDYIKCCNGPLGRSVSDLQLLTEQMSAPEINYLTQRSLPPLPWRKEATVLKEGTKLTIGYFESVDELFECHQAGQRAVREVVEALKKQGHTLIKIEVPYVKETMSIASRIFLSDGWVEPFVAISSGMKMIEPYKVLQIVYYIPHIVKQVIAMILDKLGKGRLALSLISSSPIPAKEIFVQANGQLVITSEFLKSLQEKGIQYLVSPGFGLPAPKHETTGELLTASFYTIMYNFLGMPAGTIPVTRVRKDEQTYTSKHDDPTTKFAVDCMAGSEGLPVGVQVVAMPYKDEECLALMQHVETIMKLRPILKL